MSAPETTLVCDIEITNRAGVHTRVALMIFKKVEEFDCIVSLTNKTTGHTGSCRSVLEMLSLGATLGDVVTLSITGVKADVLQKELLTLFENKFYEDEEETKSE